jgi:hypothetical protein
MQGANLAISLVVRGLVLSAVAVLAGCLADGNKRSTLSAGDAAISLPDITGVTARPERALQSDAPSPPTLARGSWERRQIIVPVDGSAGFRTYAKDIHWTRATNRQRGGPVTPLSCLDGSGDTGWVQVEETVCSPFLAFYDFAASPYRAAVRYPWVEVRHEPTPYWRASPGVAVVVDEPAKGVP